MSMIYCGSGGNGPNIPECSLHRPTIAPHIREYLASFLHFLATIPVIRQAPGDMNDSLRWGLIKAEFTKGSKLWLDRPKGTISREKRREATVWQRRFWEHMIRDDGDFSAHCDYIHYNPVKHGIVTAPKDWAYSTFHRYVEKGMYSPDWGAAPVDIPIDVAG